MIFKEIADLSKKENVVIELEMSERLIVTFDKSQEDIPVLLIGHENLFNFGKGPNFTSEIIIDNMLTGTKAVEMWNELADIIDTIRRVKE